MKRNHKFTYFSLLLSGILLFSCEFKKNAEQLNQKDTLMVEHYQPQFRGRLFTSGLSGEEAQKLGLRWPVYQIAASKSFFFSGHDSLQHYIGSCIGVNGSVLPGWKAAETINGQFTYQRGAINVYALNILSLNSCTEWEVPEKNLLMRGVIQTYKGTLRRRERPAPDIAYDYSFLLDKPIYDEFNQFESNKLVAELPLEVYEPSILNKIENATDSHQQLQLKASLVHGYAESPALQVVEVAE